MTTDEIFNELVQEFELETLPEEEQEKFLLALAETIQKQFLLDCYDRLGADMFEALEASIKMGEEFYETTLKHLIPDYETLFQQSRKKVIDAYKNSHPEIQVVSSQ